MRLPALILFALALGLSGCPTDDDDSAPADDDDAADDDDDATDDDDSGDDDDATDDDDDSAGDDDDSAVGSVESVTATPDASEVTTRDTVTLTIEAFDSDGNAVAVEPDDVSISFTTTAGDPTPVATGAEITSVTAGSFEVVVQIDLAQTNLTLSFAAAAVVAGDVKLNELLADGTAGDANGDGSTNADEDEFLEFANIAGIELDFGGATIFESELIALARHTFPEDTFVLPDEAVVVFGGGSPGAAPAGAHFFAAANEDPGTPFYLALDATGDVVTLNDAGGNAVVSLGYGDEAGGAPNANIDQAITLDPQITGTSYAPHSDVAGDPGSLFSPGTLADGTEF